ncbi:MAG: hypothetical protein J6O04_05820 [Selenomonadaceae bacterium]|nr:hypothetical protein [Selenomonadaceae bacterium]
MIVQELHMKRILDQLIVSAIACPHVRPKPRSAHLKVPAPIRAITQDMAFKLPPTHFLDELPLGIDQAIFLFPLAEFLPQIQDKPFELGMQSRFSAHHSDDAIISFQRVDCPFKSVEIHKEILLMIAAKTRAV